MAKPSPEDQKRDEILRRMLNTPHKPHLPPKPKKAKPKRKAAAKSR